MTDTIERFSDRVTNYVRYRPHYPHSIIEYLAGNWGLTPDDLIADIGCGTGISSRLFLENGNRVIGVEPNEAMRAAAIEYLAGQPRFVPVQGTADATTLADASVDMIVAAQAFHWFDPASARREFRRILKPGGRVVLIWNERQLDTTPFLIEYEAFLLRYAVDYGPVRHENITAAEIGSFFERDFSAATFPNEQIFDFDGLRGRMLSASYMPNENHEIFDTMIDELTGLFAKHAENGRIKVLYDTNVYTSQY